MFPPTADVSPACLAEPITGPETPHILDTHPALSIADVPRLLSESRAHGVNRKRYANQTHNKQHTPQIQAAEEEAALALQKRLAAHDLDPEHTSAAWALDQAPHAEIVAFLTLYAELP